MTNNVVSILSGAGMLPQAVGASVRGRWGGRGEGFANHRCVQVLQGGELGNNFLGHEI